MVPHRLSGIRSPADYSSVGCSDKTMASLKVRKTYIKPPDSSLGAHLTTFRRKIDVFGIVADGMRKQDPPGAVRRVVGSA
jgi:hypothetical protein